MNDDVHIRNTRTRSQAYRRQMRSGTSSRQAISKPSDRPTRPPLPSSKKVVEVRVQLPHLGEHRIVKHTIARLRRISREQRIIIGLLAIACMGVVAYANQTWQHSSSTHIASETTNPLAKLQRGTPTYATVLPTGKSIKELGGWTRISPPHRDPVYAYVDTINSVPVSVSEQPLPPTFSHDPDAKVRDLALAQNADKTLMAGTIKVYIGTSTNGPQSVIFNTDKLLILIKSSSVIPDEEWKNYIKSLG